MREGAGTGSGRPTWPPTVRCVSWCLDRPATASGRVHVGHSKTTALRPLALALAFATATATTAAAAIEYGGIPSVRVLVGDASAALRPPPRSGWWPSRRRRSTGACVRIGAQVIELVELPNPDPVGVDPSYNMARRRRGTWRRGGRCTRARPVACARRARAAEGVSGWRACRTRCPRGGRRSSAATSTAGPPTTAERTRLFPPYLRADDPATASPILRWGGIPHDGLHVADNEKARDFYCGVLGMVDENDLRPTKLPVPGLFLLCGEQQVLILELPNPDPDAAADRPGAGKDRCTAYTVKDLGPVRAALDAAGIAHEDLTRADGARACAATPTPTSRSSSRTRRSSRSWAKTGPMVPDAALVRFPATLSLHAWHFIDRRPA